MTAHLQAGSVIQTDDGPKKVRKPYTITKSRESWTEAEHLKFLEALQLYDRDWKKIEAFVGTKTVIQIRSHAQKYILKVQKNGTGEHVPPPRPKRKSALPYPHKAPKPVSGASAALPVPLTPSSPSPVSTATVTGASVSAAPSPAPEAMPAGPLPSPPPAPLLPSSSPHSGVVGNAPPQPLRPPPLPTARTWLHHGAPPPGSLAYGVQGQGNAKSSNAVQATGKGGKSKSSSSSSPLNSWQGSAPTEGSRPESQKRGAPDFAEVYKFIGSVFDPGSCNHIHRLKDMAPIDRETVVLLMRNLALNISSPEFSEEKLFVPATALPAVEAPSPVGSELGLPCTSSPSHMRGVRPPPTLSYGSLMHRGDLWWLTAKDGDEEGPYVGMSGPPGWGPQGGAMGPDGGHMQMHRNGSMMNGMGGNGWQHVPGPMAMHWWSGGMAMGGGPVDVEHTQYSGGEEGQTYSDAGPT